MSIPEIQCFHIGVVVKDADKAIEGYKRFLGEGAWRIRDWRNGRRTAYGVAGGQTWELFEVKGPGTSQLHAFRDRYGEGVHHIGFWTPDIKASVESALAGGAKLISTSTDAEGYTVVQLLPQADVLQSQLDELSLNAWMDVGLGGWTLEYIGVEPGTKFLQDWLAEDYQGIILNQP